MANHITQIVSFEGPGSKEAVELLKKPFKDKDYEFEISFGNIIPMPELVKGTTSGCSASEAKNPKNALAKAAGFTNWYDWSIENWGTKWDAYCQEEAPNGWDFKFQTAWSVPYPICRELTQQFPEMEITVWWCDEGGPSFKEVFEGGELRSSIDVDDDRYDEEGNHSCDFIDFYEAVYGYEPDIYHETLWEEQEVLYKEKLWKVTAIISKFTVEITDIVSNTILEVSTKDEVLETGKVKISLWKLSQCKK